MARHPYHRLRPSRRSLPEAGISEEGNIRSLHLGTPTVQSSMNLDNPAELVLSYSRAMMAWLLFADDMPQHITQLGLGGGSFARWIDAYFPETRQTAVDINPQVIQIARGMFELPFEDDGFEVVEADGAEYIKVLYNSTDIILADAFDGEQIIDAFTEEPFFADCREALRDNGIMVSNWWQADKRFNTFVNRLRTVFDNRVVVVPAATHGNAAVLAFKNHPATRNVAKLRARAEERGRRFDLELPAMLETVLSARKKTGQDFNFDSSSG